MNSKVRVLISSAIKPKTMKSLLAVVYDKHNISKSAMYSSTFELIPHIFITQVLISLLFYSFGSMCLGSQFPCFRSRKVSNFTSFQPSLYKSSGVSDDFFTVLEPICDKKKTMVMFSLLYKRTSCTVKYAERCK